MAEIRERIQFSLNGVVELTLWALVFAGLIALVPLTKQAFTLLGLVCLVSILLIWKNRQFWFSIPKQLKIILLLTFIQFLWMCFSYYLNEPSRMGDNLLWSRYVVWLFIIPLTLLFLAQTKFTVNEKSLSWLIFLMAIMYGSFAIWDSLLYPNKEYGGRAAGGMNPLEYAAISASMAMASLMFSFYFWQKNRFVAVIFCIASVLCLFSLVMTEGRGSWIALLVAIILLALLFVKRFSRRQAVVLSLSLIMLGIGVTQVSIVEKRIVQAEKEIDRYFTSKNATDSQRRSSIGARLEMWRASWMMFLESPILGVGIGNFQPEAKKLADEKKINSIAAKYYHAHNQYISAIATRGAIGLILLCVVFGLLFRFYWNCWRKAENTFVGCVSISGLLLTTIYIVAGIFDVPVEGKPTLTFFVVLNSLFMATICRNSSEKKDHPAEPHDGITQGT